MDQEMSRLGIFIAWLPYLTLLIGCIWLIVSFERYARRRLASDAAFQKTMTDLAAAVRQLGEKLDRTT